MLFSQYKEDIIYYLSRQKRPYCFLLQEHLHAGLLFINDNYLLFDQNISPDNPFLPEFFRDICHPEDEDCYFSLFECVVVFLREKSLRTFELPLKEIERRLLTYFETCGEWTVLDNTLVSNWYWRYLPKMCTDEFSASLPAPNFVPPTPLWFLPSSALSRA